MGWNLRLYVHPIYPTGIKPNARFFPVLLASTFNDYYVYSYSGGGRYRTDRSVSPAGVTLGCMSVMAGTAIALVTVIAWFAAVRALWRRREDGEPDPRFALLLAPLGALIGQIHFATKYPERQLRPDQGRLPAVHRTPCCARCSASASRGCGRRARWRWRIPALVAIGCVGLVAAYSAHARFPAFRQGRAHGRAFFRLSVPLRPPSSPLG